MVKTNNKFSLLGALCAGILMLLIFFAGCSYGGKTQNAKTEASTAPDVMVAQSSLGNIMVGSNGMTLYIFEADTAETSACYGPCASYWPPLLIAQNRTPVGLEITAKLGTIKRTDGTVQVTVNGRPVYYYAADAAKGDIRGQGSKGSGAFWYVLSPSGDVMTSKAPPKVNSTASGSGY